MEIKDLKSTVNSSSNNDEKSKFRTRLKEISKKMREENLNIFSGYKENYCG